MTSPKQMRTLLESVRTSIIESPSGIMCNERTGDGDQFFMVDSEETFQMIVYLEQSTFDEAEHWGGFTFNVGNDDDYGNKITDYSVTKADEVQKLYQMAIQNEEEGPLDELQGPYQNLFYEPGSV